MGIRVSTFSAPHGCGNVEAIREAFSATCRYIQKRVLASAICPETFFRDAARILKADGHITSRMKDYGVCGGSKNSPSVRDSAYA